ncbi:hypothetical protein F442_08604 [Phytophthora nicotianae P10297]|uniref:HAT C-terminal dimerisation domain-containing protein n=1 Tax=Phytophthora nicotianae P10297 TaxID=1317064 RepID=W2ZCQ7_PHYNI|nr:hypothetical protein F442_08604 [Phytophthora nicotianae P10297]
MHSIPPSIRDTINAFEPPDGYMVLPPRRNEKSVIFSYGVRLVKAPADSSTNPDLISPAIWMCLAGDVCRARDVSFPLSTGKTSAATKHLKKAHDITSERSEVTHKRRRTREDEFDRLRNSQLYRDDPGRVYMLLETLRIVNNNLPYRLGEYEESIAIRELVFKDALQVVINSKVVCHSIVELYTSTKKVLEDILKLNRIGAAPMFTAVTDFGYGERAGGIRVPFRRWIVEILRDFGLKPRDLYGATSDAGPDVRWLMTEGLKLQWQWCLPHLTNAATKAACGVVANTAQSKNPEMTSLIRRIVKTVYTVKHVEIMGSLFEELCLYGKGRRSPHQLLEYRAHRVLGLTRVIKRILDLWEPLISWYVERLEKARRENADLPAGFPLERDYQSLTQIMSLLYPITLLNIKCQGEKANQVDVLLTLYKVRITVLDCSKELRDYRSTKTNRMAFRPEDLTQLASITRKLLRDSAMKKCPFVLEMQLFLHPNFKSFDGFLKRIVTLCNADTNGAATAAGERHCTKIKKIIYDRVRSLMISVVKAQNVRVPVVVEEPSPVSVTQTLFSEESMDCFGDLIQEGLAVPDAAEDLEGARVDEEMERWETTPASIQLRGDRPETILKFWQRQAASNTYTFLPQVVRILFAIPTSSAQIERDFGTAGQLVTPQRGSIAPYNVDMSAFLNCNWQFVDVTQCLSIRERDISS